jgi:hypothetical protein
VAIEAAHPDSFPIASVIQSAIRECALLHLPLDSSPIWPFERLIGLRGIPANVCAGNLYHTSSVASQAILVSEDGTAEMFRG